MNLLRPVAAALELLDAVVVPQVGHVKASGRDCGAGGGAVSATVNGKHDLTALTISPDVVDPDDAEMLADLVMAAINEAHRAAAKDAEAKMGAVTGGMNVPGLF